MWRLLHKLFGWDYIHWENTADKGVARVYKSPSGEVYYWRYRTIQALGKITSPRQVVWLTCPPEKYLT